MKSWETIARRLLQFRNADSNNYELLPVANEDDRRFRAARPTSPSSSPTRSIAFACVHLITLRRCLLFFVSVFSLLSIGVLWSGIPPSYNNIREYEKKLPQHNKKLPSPEGENGMYLRFPEHLWGHGLNNVLQEHILMAHLAHLSKRSFVFEEYTWSKSPLPYTIYDFALRPSRIPMNAFISGPSVGGPIAPPRAVSASFYDSICPSERRVYIDSATAPDTLDGQELVNWWANLLDNSDQTRNASCVEIGNSPPVFSWTLFSSEKLLTLWDSLKESPAVKEFAWSPLVNSAVARNLPLLTSAPPSSVSTARSDVIRGLVAIHLRRGDYRRHCPRLAEWNAVYQAYNKFPGLPDTFSPPSTEDKEADKNGDGVIDSEEKENYYLRHCWPEIDEIVEKLREVRKERPDLQRVFVLTNGWSWWVDNLREALVENLKEEERWVDVRSSMDVQLDREQEYVNAAIDMAIAERAEVFIGNGFSSLTSNIVMLRMAKDMDPRSVRFW